MLILFVCIAIIIIVFTTDMCLKKYFDTHYIEQNINNANIRKEKAIFGGKIILTKFHNSGFAGSRAEKYPKIVMIISLIFTLLSVVLFIISFGKGKNTLTKLALSFLLGGAFSNTYDRLKRKYVVDYFKFNITGGKTPFSKLIFNLADIFIIIGTVLFVISSK